MTTLHAPGHEYADESALLDDFHARGWTDGLPVVAPTPERVAAFLAAAQLAPDVVLGEVPTRQVVVTAEHAAINAVMAGCRPEYMPVVVAAVRAHLHEKGWILDPRGQAKSVVFTEEGQRLAVAAFEKHFVEDRR